MKNLRKITIVLLFILTVGFLVNIPKVEAASLPSNGSKVSTNHERLELGKKYRVGYNQYKGFSNIFCVEHEERLWSEERDYTVRWHVRIEDDVAFRINKDGKKIKSIKEIQSPKNLNLATAIATLGHHDLQEWLWKHFGYWVTSKNKQGKETGVGANLGIDEDFANKVSGNDYKDAEEIVENKVEQIEEKATELKNETEKSKIRVTTKSHNNVQYTRVGPFKFSGVPSKGLQSLNVYDQNGKKITGAKILMYFNNSGKQEEKWYDLDKRNENKDIPIKNNKNYYICIRKEDDATKITKITAKTKEIQIPKVTADIYFLKCEAAPSWQNLIVVDGDYKTEPFDSSIDIDYDIDLVGDLELIKVDSKNDKLPLPNVTFKFKHNKLGWVHRNSKGEITYKETEEEATPFVTEESGENKGKIIVKGLDIGTYTYKEVSNANEYYKITNKTGKFTISVDKTKTVCFKMSVPNDQVYVKLSGYVWLDEIRTVKQTEPNYQFYSTNEDVNDCLLDKITVKLMDKSTNPPTVVATTETSKLGMYSDSGNNGHGEYVFDKVEIEKLPDYYIEFEYDGLTYTNVPSTLNVNKGSKAIENPNTRTEFNKNFSVIEGPKDNEAANIGHTSGGAQSYKLEYNKIPRDYRSELANKGIYTEKTEGKETYYEQDECGDFPITANTSDAGFSIKDQFTQGIGQIEIRYINLGLCKREQPNIGLVKVLENVRLEINDRNHVYEYANIVDNMFAGEDKFNVGVKFGTLKDKSFTRAIYKSDIEYRDPNPNDNQNGELQAFITYKITMKNNTTTNLLTKINSIAEYYDSKYTLIGVGTELDSNKHIVQNLTATNDLQYNKDGYKKAIIDTNQMLEGQDEKDIYVEFKLSREAIEDILRDKGVAVDEDLLNNVVEINTYSCFDKNGNIYAAVDMNSNPGNATPADMETYESDTAESPALRLETANARQMEGTVFLDESILTAENERLGNGQYDGIEKDKGISGVKVTLTEKSGAGQTYTCDTGEDGQFKIEGYIPGDYQVIYTWGNNTYSKDGTQINVQEYKGTIYVNKERASNKKWYEMETPRYSDAIDNWDTRISIDSEMTDMAETVNTEKTMDSTTPEMDIGIEHKTYTDDSTGERFINIIPNIDFGIVERPRQILNISKDVTAIKVTLANGLPLMDAKVENGKLVGDSIKGLTYMAPSGDNKGFVKAEIDNELIQDAKMQIEYTFKVENNGETDYATEEYYKYGENKTNKVTITPTGVYDYFDNGIALDTSKNNEEQGWQQVTTRETYDDNIDKTAIEKYFEKSKQEDNSYKFETTIEEYIRLLKEWSVEIQENMTTRDVKLNNSTIIENKALERALEPGQSNTAKLYTSKILANTDEIDLNNDTEITKSKRNTITGRIPDVRTSRLYDQSEAVTVTTPTGEDKNYTVPIAIGISTLIILGVGVIVIKKKVVDKK